MHADMFLRSVASPFHYSVTTPLSQHEQLSRSELHPHCARGLPGKPGVSRQDIASAGADGWQGRTAGKDCLCL